MKGQGFKLRNGDNRVEANQVTDNPTGIRANDQGSLINRNSTSGNSVDDFVFQDGIGAADADGPVVNVVAVGDISATAGANHPWASFVYLISISRKRTPE